MNLVGNVQRSHLYSPSTCFTDSLACKSHYIYMNRDLLLSYCRYAYLVNYHLYIHPRYSPAHCCSDSIYSSENLVDLLHTQYHSLYNYSEVPVALMLVAAGKSGIDDRLNEVAVESFC